MPYEIDILRDNLDKQEGVYYGYEDLYKYENLGPQYQIVKRILEKGVKKDVIYDINEFCRNILNDKEYIFTQFQFPKDTKYEDLGVDRYEKIHFILEKIIIDIENGIEMEKIEDFFEHDILQILGNLDSSREGSSILCAPFGAQL